MSEHDPVVDELEGWIRRHPEVWPRGDAAPMTDERMGELVDEILAPASRDELAKRRRRRAIVAGVGVAVVVSGGVAAAVIRGGQPTVPHQGSLCRADTDLTGSAIVVNPDEDPIEGCERLWADGHFDELGAQSRVPLLTACVGPNGVVEVFPAGETICGELGLAVADPELSPENVAIVELNDRLVEEINLAECVPVEEAAAIARRILDESPLQGWEVVILPEAEGSDCGAAGTDPELKEIFIQRW